MNHHICRIEQKTGWELSVDPIISPRLRRFKGQHVERHQIGPCLAADCVLPLRNTQVGTIETIEIASCTFPRRSAGTHTRLGCLRQSAETGSPPGTCDGSKLQLTRSNCRFGNNCRFAHPPGKHHHHAETKTRQPRRSVRVNQLLQRYSAGDASPVTGRLEVSIQVSVVTLNGS